MTTYAVTRKADGVEVYRYNADQPISWVGFEFETHDHTAVPDPVDVVTDVVPVRMVWSPVAFLRRFTQAERTAIRQAATQVEALDDFMFLLSASQEVYSDDPDVVDGLTMLEGAGLIGAGRAQEILG